MVGLQESTQQCQNQRFSTSVQHAFSSGYVMTYMSHHTLPLKHIKELQKSSCTLKLIELLGLTSLNGSFSREGTKQTSLTKSFLRLPSACSPFCKGERKLKLRIAVWCNYVSCCFNLSLALRLNTCVSRFCPLITSLTLYSHSRHPTRHLCLYEGKKRTLLEGQVSFCGTHLSSRVRMTAQRSGVRSRLSAPRHQHIRVMSLFIKSARLRLTKPFHRSMLVQSS